MHSASDSSDGATMDDFHALLRTLMSPDNASRQQAEQAYDGVKQQNPGMLLSCLAQTVRSCADATLRAFGAVLLRRAAHDVYNKPACGAEARAPNLRRKCMKVHLKSSL